MLVLARHLNESIMIGDDIEVIVVAVQGDQVKLGIRAPRSVAVHRKEIFEEIQRENLRAAQARGDAAAGAEILKKTMGKKPSQKPDTQNS
ncbi:MAG: carbon storage regulator [Candidatus Hydrogenedentota bacterium]|nr:MAG: carbon storage regulator [Candidatus Hydrogenedentota bacterium]